MNERIYLKENYRQRGHNFVALLFISSSSTHSSWIHLPQRYFSHSLSVPGSLLNKPKRVTSITIYFIISILHSSTFLGPRCQKAICCPLTTLSWSVLPLAYLCGFFFMLICFLCCAFRAFSSFLCYASSSFCLFFNSLSSVFLPVLIVSVLLCFKRPDTFCTGQNFYTTSLGMLISHPWSIDQFSQR